MTFITNRNAFASMMTKLRTDVHGFSTFAIAKSMKSQKLQKSRLLKSIAETIQEINTEDFGIKIIVMKTVLWNICRKYKIYRKEWIHHPPWSSSNESPFECFLTDSKLQNIISSSSSKQLSIQTVFQRRKNENIQTPRNCYQTSVTREATKARLHWARALLS